MKTFDVQTISLDVSQQQAFALISDAQRLPEWAQAFSSVDGGRALMRTPSGEVDIALDVRASSDTGSVDWYMTFPDGSIATAYSRIVSLGSNNCVYMFVLTPPPVPLEQLEGVIEIQSQILARELVTLKGIIENGE